MSKHRTFILLLASLLAFVCASASAQKVVVSGTNVGPIPDNSTRGLTVAFKVPDIRLVKSVKLDITLTHSWVGDLDGILYSPNGDAKLVLFSRVAAGIGDPFGDASDLDGTYTFSDAGSDFWAAAASTGAADPIRPSNYRSSTAGQPGLSDFGGCFTYMNAAFGNKLSQSMGVPSQGSWTLVIRDLESGESGSVTAARLTLQLERDVLFADGFEAVVPSTSNNTSTPNNASTSNNNCTRGIFDFTGNGLTDFTLLADDGGTRVWKVRENTGGGAGGAVTKFPFGPVTPQTNFQAGDIDGDGIADPIIIDSASGIVQVRRSSRPQLPPLEIGFGPPEAGESRDFNAIGDYDGDGIDDLGLSRQRSGAPFGPAFLDYIRSSDGVFVTIPAGDNTTADLETAGGEDFTGDGLADVILKVGNVPDYTVYNGANGTVADTFTFGTASDIFEFAANQSGDARADITTTRLVANDLFWESRTTGTGVSSVPVLFGGIVTGFSTFATPGDYDGDGFLDYSYWLRDNSGATPSQFKIIPSSNPGAVWTVDFGDSTEAPVITARQF